MTQNRSSAAITTANQSTSVMQRNSEPHGSLGDFPTPPWATRALLNRLYHTPGKWDMTCREPAANRGHMVRPLAERFRDVEASDIHCYGAGFAVNDYLFGPDPDPVDWTITNPPFQLAEQFIARARASSRVGVAVLVRSAFLEGQERFQTLFSQSRPALVLQFSERVVIHKGLLAPKGSTATAYAWFVWYTALQNSGTMLEWIPPCRAALERPGDYPDGGRGLAVIGGSA